MKTSLITTMFMKPLKKMLKKTLKELRKFLREIRIRASLKLKIQIGR